MPKKVNKTVKATIENGVLPKRDLEAVLEKMHRQAAERAIPFPVSEYVDVGYAEIGHSYFDDELWEIITSDFGYALIPVKPGPLSVHMVEWSSAFKKAGFRVLKNSSEMHVSCLPHQIKSCIAALRQWVETEGGPALLALEKNRIYKEGLRKAEALKIPCQCGGHAVWRSSYYGDFFGCSRYPECRNTAQVNKITGMPTNWV